MHEGPWHLLPTGQCQGSASVPAQSVLLERSVVGERITVTGAVGSLTYTQRLTLWYGERRLDCVTTIDTFHGQDELVRLRWACAVPGALPVSEVADAVVGRGFAHPDVDSAQQPWTLDNPAYGWFGLTSTARVALLDQDGNPVGDRAIGIAEIVVPTAEETSRLGRDLSVALVKSGVTATCSFADGFRYGNIAFDSNLPDVRISVGGPAENGFTAAVLAAAGEAYAAELQRQLDRSGVAAVWVPAARPLAQSWVPDADLTGPLDLPVLVLAATGDLAVAVAFAVGELRESRIPVRQPAALSGGDLLEDRTVAILNRGLPGFAVDSEGRLHLSLLRSCTGWPSGVWIDPPRRYAPDGSGFPAPALDPHLRLLPRRRGRRLAGQRPGGRCARLQPPAHHRADRRQRRGSAVDAESAAGRAGPAGRAVDAQGHGSPVRARSYDDWPDRWGTDRSGVRGPGQGRRRHDLGVAAAARLRRRRPARGRPARSGRDRGSGGPQARCRGRHHRAADGRGRRGFERRARSGGRPGPAGAQPLLATQPRPCRRRQPAGQRVRRTGRSWAAARHRVVRACR